VKWKQFHLPKAFQIGNMQEYSPEINHGKRRMKERERNKAK
jgi:hypothetical protein